MSVTPGKSLQKRIHRPEFGETKVLQNLPGIKVGIIATVEGKKGPLPLYWAVSPHRKYKDRTWGAQTPVPMGSYARELFDDTFKNWGRTYEQARAESKAAKKAKIREALREQADVEPGGAPEGNERSV